ncbi:MAG: type I-A CRISPR-associated protein Csa5 [Nitrososphaerota archaeon]|nr:type I-A CRISPR-associated protein Csa5 [Nitrososphaerota archaeon]
MSHQVPESEVESTRRYRSVAVLLASAAALIESPSLIDRMSNALNPEPAARSIKDALRILDSEVSQPPDRRRLSITETVGEKGEVRTKIVVSASEEAGQVEIYGQLPNNEIVRRFIEDVERDITIARKIGTLASAILVEAKLKAAPGGE